MLLSPQTQEDFVDLCSNPSFCAVIKSIWYIKKELQVLWVVRSATDINGQPLSVDAQLECHHVTVDRTSII